MMVSAQRDSNLLDSDLEIADLETDESVMEATPELAAPEPAELAETLQESEADLMGDQVPASMDELPVSVPLQARPAQDTGITVHIARREIMGFVSGDGIDAATTIIESPSPRTWLVAGDEVYLGLGEGQTEVGEEFTIYQDAIPVFDLNGRRLLGYHVEILGWAVVKKVHRESSMAELRMVSTEISIGYRALPRLFV